MPAGPDAAGAFLFPPRRCVSANAHPIASPVRQTHYQYPPAAPRRKAPLGNQIRGAGEQRRMIERGGITRSRCDVAQGTPSAKKRRIADDELIAPWRLRLPLLNRRLVYGDASRPVAGRHVIPRLRRGPLSSNSTASSWTEFAVRWLTLMPTNRCRFRYPARFT